MSYVYMKVLETAPERYDVGMRLLTLGRLDRVRSDIALRLRCEDRVLDIGCGTGMLAVIMAQRGCYVSGIDVAQPMLRQAERRVREANLSDLVDLQELGVADLDVAFPDAHFDAIVSTLVFSELSDDEISYTLAHCWRILKPGGQLLLADEVLPDSVAGRWATFLFRLPFKLLAFVLTQSTTHRVASLPDRIKAAGFVMHSVTRYLGGTLRLFVATVATAPEASSWEERPPSQEAGSGCQAC